MYAGYDMPAVDAKSVRDLRLEIEEFHTEYCAMLDRGALDNWVDFFAEDALYRITSRENADAPAASRHIASEPPRPSSMRLTAMRQASGSGVPVSE